jgi:hypothetical protein
MVRNIKTLRHLNKVNVLARRYPHRMIGNQGYFDPRSLSRLKQGFLNGHGARIRIHPN